MSGRNTLEVIIKLLMTKKVRIRVWKEEGDLATNMADRLGRQKLTKEYLAGPNFSMPRRMIGIIKNEENMLQELV